MRLKCMIPLAIIGMVLLAHEVRADEADSCGCNAVLIPTFESHQSAKQLEMAYLKLIDRETFSEIQKKREGGLSAVIKAVPINVTADFGQFSTWRDRYFEAQGFNENETSATAFVRRGLDPKAIEAWEKCKKDCQAKRRHLRCEITQVDEQMVSVRVSWNPPAGLGATKIVPQIAGAAEAANSPLKDGLEIVANGEFAVRFKREPRKPFSITINASHGYAAEAYAPAWVQPPAANEELVDVMFRRGNAPDRGILVPQTPNERRVVVYVDRRQHKKFGKKVVEIQKLKWFPLEARMDKSTLVRSGDPTKRHPNEPDGRMEDPATIVFELQADGATTHVDGEWYVLLKVIYEP